MSRSCPSFKPLMAEALFGEIAEADRHRLDAHLADCDACTAEFRSLQSTLNVTATYEHPERPDAYWDAFSNRLYDRLETEAPALSQVAGSDTAPEASPDADPLPWRDRLKAWWNARPALLPQTAPQWGLQLAVALLLVAGGLVLGRWSSDAPVVPSNGLGGSLTNEALSTSSPSVDPLLRPIGTAAGDTQVRPRLTGVEDITYDMTQGVVEIRYHTTNEVVVRGAPDDPRIQRLLQAALLDEGNPSSRLHAVKTLEASPMAPDEELVSALTYLVREQTDPNMRLRALRALRRLHERTPLSETTRGVLVNVLLQAEMPALRIEALDALAGQAAPRGGDATADALSFLYEARSDSNAYVRYRAEELLQQARTEASTP